MRRTGQSDSSSVSSLPASYRARAMHRSTTCLVVPLALQLSTDIVQESKNLPRKPGGREKSRSYQRNSGVTPLTMVIPSFSAWTSSRCIQIDICKNEEKRNLQQKKKHHNQTMVGWISMKPKSRNPSGIPSYLVGWAKKAKNRIEDENSTRLGKDYEVPLAEKCVPRYSRPNQPSPVSSRIMGPCPFCPLMPETPV